VLLGDPARLFLGGVWYDSNRTRGRVLFCLATRSAAITVMFVPIAPIADVFPAVASILEVVAPSPLETGVASILAAVPHILSLIAAVLSVVPHILQAVAPRGAARIVGFSA